MLSAQRLPLAAFAFWGVVELRAYVYIDGFNLYYAIKSTGCKWLNPKLLAQQLVPTATIQKVRYFTARVSGAVDPGAPGRQQVLYNALATVPEVEIHFGTFLAKAQWRPVMLLPVANRMVSDGNGSSSVLPAGSLSVDVDPNLSKSRSESLIVGSYGAPGNTPPSAKPDAVKARVFAMEEKGSDVNLAVHLVNDAWAGNFDAALVISNDTDLVEPIRLVAQGLGKPVYLLTPPGKYGVAKPLANVATHQRHIRQSHLAASLFPDPVVAADGTLISKPASW